MGKSPDHEILRGLPNSTAGAEADLDQLLIGEEALRLIDSCRLDGGEPPALGVIAAGVKDGNTLCKQAEEAEIVDFFLAGLTANPSYSPGGSGRGDRSGLRGGAKQAFVG